MRNFIAIILVMILALSLCACGNENWGVGNYTFRHVHFSDAVEGHCATIESWHDNTSGIELHTVECGDLYLSEGTYMLFRDASGCPFCGE